jgi:hypothetical protein
MADRIQSIARQLRNQGLWTNIPPYRNFVHYAPPVVYYTWKGYTECSHTNKITVFTSQETILLAVGSNLYLDKKLNIVYSEPYFVFNGIRYTIEGGLITNLVMCSIYDI